MAPRNLSASLNTDISSRYRTHCPYSPAQNYSIASCAWIRVMAIMATTNHKCLSIHSRWWETVFQRINFKCTIRQCRLFDMGLQQIPHWPVLSVICCRVCQICRKWMATAWLIWRRCWDWALKCCTAEWLGTNRIICIRIRRKYCIGMRIGRIIKIAITADAMTEATISVVATTEEIEIDAIEAATEIEAVNEEMGISEDTTAIDVDGSHSISIFICMTLLPKQYSVSFIECSPNLEIKWKLVFYILNQYWMLIQTSIISFSISYWIALMSLRIRCINVRRAIRLEINLINQCAHWFRWVWYLNESILFSIFSFSFRSKRRSHVHIINRTKYVSNASHEYEIRCSLF